MSIDETMAGSSAHKRPVRIAGCSGGFTDRSRAIESLAGDPEVDAIIGDWLSEMVRLLYPFPKLLLFPSVLTGWSVVCATG